MAPRFLYHPTCLHESTTCVGESTFLVNQSTTCVHESTFLVKQSTTCARESSTLSDQSSTCVAESSTCARESTFLSPNQRPCTTIAGIRAAIHAHCPSASLDSGHQRGIRSGPPQRHFADVCQHVRTCAAASEAHCPWNAGCELVAHTRLFSARKTPTSPEPGGCGAPRRRNNNGRASR